MDLIRLSIERPIAVMAAVIMLILFGLVALNAIPIQLTPDIRKPVISIQTIWPSAAPAEIEREIVVKQEEVLKGIEGLEEIRSESQDGRARITLEFAIGTNMDKALLLTSNRLDRVSGYPDEADEPSIRTASAEDNPIAWFVIIRNPGNNEEIHKFGDFAEEIIQDRIERVAGIARVNLYGASKKEMTIFIEPGRLARYGLTVTEVLSKLRVANSSVSAGDVDEGKRRYVVRTEGKFTSLEDVSAVVLRSERDETTGRFARVTVGDVGTVRWDTSKPTERIRFNGQPAMAFNAIREGGANVIAVMEGIREAVAELNEFALPSQALELRQVYDETVYINSSIDLVRQNIVVGGILAALMLLLFLRSGGATLIVSMAIPVSVIGAFVAMAAMGRSLNVISLAGIAFAVGMVVDAAIVVLENIFRHREQGKSRAEAAYQGAKQVWVAVLVSALTTVMVFIPILVMDLEAGQLFRDIAVALSVSVLISLLVAITLIPALANRILGSPGKDSIVRRRLPVVDDLASLFVRTIMNLTAWVTRSRIRAVTIVAVLCSICIGITWQLLPKLDYLPSGNRNLIIGYIVPPPGYNLDTMEEIARGYEDQVRPLLTEVSGTGPDPEGRPKLNRFFFVTFRGLTILGAAAHDPTRVKELIPVLSKAAFNEPGTLGQINQRSLFGRGVGGSREIELNIMGAELEPLLATALKTFNLVNQKFPYEEGNMIRPKPELVLGAPEVRVKPNRVKLADNGVTARELSDTIDTFNDGLRVAEITVGNKLVDLMLKGPLDQVVHTQGISHLPVVTSQGLIIPASSLSDVELTTGPTQINHLERQRVVTLSIIPRQDVPLEVALDTIRENVIDSLRAEGLPPGITLRLTGTADKLNQTWEAMKLDLGIAVIIVFLVMAVLFESFIYPFIIMLSVPLATAGGVVGLSILNQFTFQPLDMLTLLGFVILIGIVVNNAILLVHQTLVHLREDKLPPADAIREATRNRIRPIFMSTLTSVFGMMPLVVVPGSGSELYRGLGSVVLGGLSLSALLTLAIIPPLLTLVIGVGESRHRKSEDAKTSPSPAE